ncbi:antitoxin VapB [Rhizobium sp. RU20A]|uniref:antitoxin n=1 Tax=Rhizobium sp. RU20A TaxID=1907412 RepID=UPI0009545568|nr:AbrB/MazE/SpoVT family DNA-binding domain-containing protein [Rhizobium sp. RU20A]SIP92612.1 antitoxin VapB [Rhizobium sp. RU20A]
MSARPKDATENTPERAVKLFRNGRNQAVRIPVEFELPGHEAIMRKEGDRLIIEPARAEPANLFEWLQSLEPLDEEVPDLDEHAPPPREFNL